MFALRLFATGALLVSIALLAGCKPKEPTNSPPAPSPKAGPGPRVSQPEATGPHAAGIKVFNSQGCSRCHNVGGSGKKKGPDLAKVASNPEHTQEWLKEFILNPKSKKPRSRMPPFEGKINDEDFTALLEYLASLK